MATEALDLPRSVIIGVRMPRRLRVLIRAMRIARVRRALRLFRRIDHLDDHIRADLGVCGRRDGRYDWLGTLMRASRR